MAPLYLAYTSRINPSGASPVLTVPQVWQGLQRKIRFAQEFVKIIESCDVLSEKDGVVERFVKFQAGLGPKDSAKETVVSFEPAWVDFRQEDGTTIRNVVSDGPSGQPEDLHMTYIFEFNLPDLPEAEREAKEKQLKGMAKMAVESSITVIREMVVDGRIQS
ncbi:DUF1857-domain-containing protein [Polyplosphaeria fusca]|uniref:DUF1857-domain-containing protein n=1 Tax=Polyplosphaeria fusca TaxID=682080 RepID=A0A9P4V2E4_9PLEO|nr:DUF1857-domain-containing protein [Polyplosphaeria fusca]